MAFLKNPITRTLGIIFCMIIIMLFSSFTTKKTMEKNLADYANYEFAESVNTVLKQKGGVMEQLRDIKEIATDARNGVEQSNDQMYKLWIIDINKYYKQIITGHSESITSEHLTKLSNYWECLPKKYKTDIVISHYNYDFNWIQEHCK